MSWILVVVVWTLSNGQMTRHDFMAQDTFRSQAECVERGRANVGRFGERVDNVAGVAFLCVPEDQVSPLAPPVRAYSA